MTDPLLDRIHIRDLSLRCIVGVNAEERRKKQDVIVNVTLFADLGLACRSDEIGETVDYKTLKERVVETVEGSSFHLVEALAERIAGVCLDHPLVRRAAVTVDKPGAFALLEERGRGCPSWEGGSLGGRPARGALGFRRRRRRP